MRAGAGIPDYYLVFASQNSLGLRKMKEAMRGIARNGSYSFSGVFRDQLPLFRDDDPEVFGQRLHSEFAGRNLSYREVDDFALNYSPFENPKKMLRYLEKNDSIVVASRNPRRRRGTFKEEDIDSITFRTA
jgi:hypothetical protein